MADAAHMAIEQAGCGCCSAPIEGPLVASIWAAMCTKVWSPEDFLPVKDGECRSLGEATLWRRMTFFGPGPLHGITVYEHIYMDEVKLEIRFVHLADDGQEGPTETVNALLLRPNRLEYYERDRATCRRVHWPAPQAVVMQSIERTVELALSQPAGDDEAEDHAAQRQSQEEGAVSA
mmetsp:Transcript_77644/g.214568  ORF Transcript_77644/g.214568 Transcript_77644/m.214568 type:complete len:177 (+) Transcript_77644:14-544(+)|eukprot:CAMPEP_0179015392 /NCGR_PEP_ID=MMETSP0796-20121207/2763_1 /TAXON_ID=73915 /ORGANISM="Pyrodinium bahamense, Strain pbaha01" /LENGTH=176 /DNA_ID=CAMNT_0020711015 /DNA_START=14 /DNA_END=544 /DNA_ORIENTATION=-